MIKSHIKWHRIAAVIAKEFVQMRRDRMTFAMMVGIPLMQLLLFGYAINMNPKQLPIALQSADHSEFTRAIVKGMENTDYFHFTRQVKTEQEAQHLLRTNQVKFVLSIPQNFTQKLIRGEHPQLLLEADATDPTAVNQALAAMNGLMLRVLQPYADGPLVHLQVKPLPIDFVAHSKYNPEIISQYNIVPGLLGVILTMTLIIITASAMTRERERGTIESLLSTPVRPLEVMIGKVTPYIIVGYIQVALVLLAAALLFHVPIEGNLLLLLLATLPFIAANLTVGLLFSILAKSQLQAVQMSFFFFLPSLLLSGFMFPFRGMPEWAQWIGSVLPLTHFLRIVRGILLKGNGWEHIQIELWPILGFLVVVLVLGMLRYRQTLD